MVATHSTTPSVFNDAMPTVTNPGPGKTVVYTFPAGVAALKAGKKIQYIGATGVINFNQYHNSFGDQEAVQSTSTEAPVPLGKVSAKQIQAVPVSGVA